MGSWLLPVDFELFQDEYPAPRPRSEMLRNAKLEELGTNRIRNWADALRTHIKAE
jgi:hypothetical protein